MSRRRPHDTLHGIQLFPFVAVLLCTMGSLLVLLVGVARNSKVQATEEAAAQQAAAQAAAVARAAEAERDAVDSRLELEKIAKYQAEIAAVRAKAGERLREDKQRMSHLEDHMRRLREKLETLKLAAVEMNGLEGQQVDNRRQAESEILRLEQLIAESRANIEQLRADAQLRARSYAIVPYQGKSGTFRRPIYIECREDGVVLQPEGVLFTREDFQPPIGPGNPLVAAVRAAREHIINTESNAAAGKAAEPYPLIIVRPKGVQFYYCTREAVQSWDSEFGYELVEEDWDLKFGSADPKLANVEFDAAELARGRLRALAAAAPKAYGAYRGGGGGGPGGAGAAYGGHASGPGSSYNAESTDAGDGGSPRFASRPGARRAIVVGPAMGRASGDGRGERESGATVGGPSGAGGLTDDRYAAKGPALLSAPSTGTGGTGGAAAGNRQAGADNGSSGPGGPSATGPSSTATNGPRPHGAQPIADGDLNSEQPRPTGRYAGAYNPEDELDDMARAAASNEDPEAPRPRRGVPRGKNWAIRNANAGMIPIRRTIQIEVRDDALVVQSESTGKARSQEFRFGELPEAAYEELVTAVDKRIDDWGMAGQGLYWRPVVEVKVAAGGEPWVDDLMRLLEHSGVEVRYNSVAQHESEGADRANR